MKHLKQRLLGAVLSITMVSSAFSIAVLASEPAQKPADYDNELYFEDFEGDTELDAATTMKYGSSTATIKSGDSNLTTEVEAGEYLELKDTADSSNSLQFGVEYEADTSPVESRYPASKVDELKKTQVSFDLCLVDIEKQITVYFRDQLSTTNTKSASLMSIKTDGTFSFSGTDATYSYTEGDWVSVDFYFDFGEQEYSVYVDDVAVFENATLSATLDKCVESFVFHTGSLSDGQKYTFYVDNMRIAIPKKFEILNSVPASGSTTVDISDDVIITMTDKISNFHPSLVTVSGGTSLPDYEVLESDGVITISFDGDLEYETEYTVTLDKSIANMAGTTLGTEDKVITFTTCERMIVYNKELFFEDFEGDTEIDSKSFDKNSTPVITIDNDDSQTDSSKEQGNYVKIVQDNQEGKDSQFRMKFGSSNSPVASQYTAEQLDELSKTQVSFDICPMDYKRINIRFYDQLSNSSSAKSETLIILSETAGYISFKNAKDSEGNSIKVPYNDKEWMSFNIYFDFDSDTYSVFLNGENIVRNVSVGINLTECVESVGIQSSTSGAASFSVFMDNIRVAVAKKFEVLSTSPVAESTSANVTDDIKIVLSNEIDNFSSSLVTVTGGTPAPSYSVVTDKENITISFTGNMNFNTEYTVTLDKDIRDIYGNTLGTEDKIIKFKTILEQITSSIPKFSDKVSATVVNPAGASITPTLVVVVKNADGSVDILTDDVPDASGSKFEVNFDFSSLSDGQTVFAFVTDGISSLNLLRDVVSSPDNNFVSEESEVTVSLDETKLVGNELTIKGKISAPMKKNIIIKVMNESDAPEFIMPVQTDSTGEFSYVIPADALTFEEKYTISVTGYNMAESNKKSIYNLSATEKNTIKTLINGATDADAIEALLVSDEYKEQMNLEEALYNENTYNTLYEQLQYASYDKIIEMVYKADSLLKEINEADWSDYTGLFGNNSDIILKTAEQLEKYNAYEPNQKNAINKIIIDGSPFSTFKGVRTAFDSAVKEYSASLNGGSGGGGGGGSSSKKEDTLHVDTSTKEDEQIHTDNNKPVNVTLFSDMSAAKWAEESVKELYTRGIVSASENFRPMDNVTREEFVKMLVQLAGLQLSETPDFTDVGGNEWFAPYLGAAQSAGIIQGSGNGNFGVGQFISRQDMVVMAQRVLTVMNKSVETKTEELQFADSNEISEYALSAVSMMQRAGIVSGMGNGCFEPKGVASRAQSAVIICNLINAME